MRSLNHHLLESQGLPVIYLEPEINLDLQACEFSGRAITSIKEARICCDHKAYNPRCSFQNSCEIWTPGQKWRTAFCGEGVVKTRTPLQNHFASFCGFGGWTPIFSTQAVSFSAIIHYQNLKLCISIPEKKGRWWAFLIPHHKNHFFVRKKRSLLGRKAPKLPLLCGDKMIFSGNTEG